MNWLWLDPGETVGWARGSVRSGSCNTGTRCVFDENATIPKAERKLCVEDWGQHKSKTFLLQLLESAKDYDVIGYESYNIQASKLRAHVGSNVPTLQVIGGIRLAAWHAQDYRIPMRPRLVTQQPREKNTGMAAAKLWLPADQQDVVKDALAGPHDDGHYGDAILHAVAWFHKNYAS